MLRECDPSDVHLLLRRIQYVDYRLPTDETRSRLLAAFSARPARELIASRPLAPAAVPAPAPASAAASRARPGAAFASPPETGSRSRRPAGDGVAETETETETEKRALSAGAPMVAGVVVGVWLVVFLAFRYVSLGSLAAAVAIPISQLALHQALPDVLVGSVLAVLIIGRHRGNLQRLLSGVEPRAWPR